MALSQNVMNYSGHDFQRLRYRWDSFAKLHGWHQVVLGGTDEYPVLVLQNERSLRGGKRGLYVSAGVHGDECAPPQALIEWAESDPEVLREIPVILVPCFNPVGLVDNTRCDGDGVDLNRNFHNRELPLIEAWQSFLEGQEFEVALNLHEDYDATGIYLYEVARGDSPGDEFLSACQDVIPRESAPSVDGVDFENGLLSHDPKDGELSRVVEEDLGGGMPEAIYLFLNHSRNSFTFETPSEMDLTRRVSAHRRFLEVASRHFA